MSLHQVPPAVQAEVVQAVQEPTGQEAPALLDKVIVEVQVMLEELPTGLVAVVAAQAAAEEVAAQDKVVEVAVPVVVELTHILLGQALHQLVLADTMPVAVAVAAGELQVGPAAQAVAQMGVTMALQRGSPERQTQAAAAAVPRVLHQRHAKAALAAPVSL